MPSLLRRAKLRYLNRSGVVIILISLVIIAYFINRKSLKHYREQIEQEQQQQHRVPKHLHVSIKEPRRPPANSPDYNHTPNGEDIPQAKLHNYSLDKQDSAKIHKGKRHGDVGASKQLAVGPPARKPALGPPARQPALGPPARQPALGPPTKRKHMLHPKTHDAAEKSDIKILKEITGRRGNIKQDTKRSIRKKNIAPDSRKLVDHADIKQFTAVPPARKEPLHKRDIELLVRGRNANRKADTNRSQGEGIRHVMGPSEANGFREGRGAKDRTGFIASNSDVAKGKAKLLKREKHTKLKKQKKQW